MIEIIIKKSSMAGKKYDAIIDGKKTVHFGAVGMSDFTLHKDPERKQRYIDRHKANENWNDYTTPGFFSRWLLWNKPTLSESIRDLNLKHNNIHFKLK